jgi:hypothetical protein
MSLPGFIFFCEHGGNCKWQGFALHKGLGWGKIPKGTDWHQWHVRECGGTLAEVQISAAQAGTREAPAPQPMEGGKGMEPSEAEGREDAPGEPCPSCHGTYAYRPCLTCGANIRTALDEAPKAARSDAPEAKPEGPDPKSPSPSEDLEAVRSAADLVNESKCKTSRRGHGWEIDGEEAVLVRSDYLRLLLDKIAAFTRPSPPVQGVEAQAPGGLVWSGEKPTADGFYWYRVPGHTTQSIDLVQVFTGSPCWHSAERHRWLPIPSGLEWAGPIHEPAAPGGAA